MAFGSASTTSPSNSTFSSFAKLDDPCIGGPGTRDLAGHTGDLRALGECAALPAIPEKPTDRHTHPEQAPWAPEPLDLVANFNQAGADRARQLHLRVLQRAARALQPGPASGAPAEPRRTTR